MTDEKRIDDQKLDDVSGGADLRRATDPDPVPDPPAGGGTGSGEVQERPDGDQKSTID